MTAWKISPAGVQRTLEKIPDDFKELQDALKEDSLESCFSGLEWGGAITAAVPKALYDIFDDHKDELSLIINSISAGMLGVGNATRAYQLGQQDMSGNFQREAISSAKTGDFSYFEKNGYKGD
ncbi:DUF6507 family protein [Brevibacterium sp. Marseille-P9724]|uniref:DUF6507 family protein n=1 Tax=Brevibacterium sp. Marseille-P9724 TaxID=2614125 RepID=UPI00125FCA93|nr:DUF6507 family protein [Brevibacterium sp. Marseille-P9724]